MTLTIINQRKIGTKIFTKAGSGSYGDVYIVEDETGKQMAVKIIDPSKLSYVEMDVLTRLKSPYIIRSVGDPVAEIQHSHGITLQLKENCIHKLNTKKLPYYQLKRIMVSCLFGLRCMHAKGYLHNDLVLRNILYDKDENDDYLAYLADFSVTVRCIDAQKGIKVRRIVKGSHTPIEILGKSFASFEGKTKRENSKIDCLTGEINPSTIPYKSNRKYEFKCDVCGHIFINSICNITGNGRWCPYCSNQKLCEDRLCVLCHFRSFASCNLKTPNGTKLINCWIDDIDKRTVFKNSGKKYKFKCDLCNHSLFICPNDIVGYKKNWCKYCTNQNLCEDNKCSICCEKTFHFRCNLIEDGDMKLKSWDYTKNKQLPTRIFGSTQKKFWFKCYKCDHDFDSTPGHILNGRWCPYCSKPCKKLCRDMKCKVCFRNSLASFEGITEEGKKVLQMWSLEKNNTIPRQVIRNSANKYWFFCEICNENFRIKTCNLVRGAWCSNHLKKTEVKMYKILKKDFDIIYQPSFSWCKNSETKRKLPFDFLIEDLKIIIELDGEQHFTQVSNWDSPTTTQRKDRYKMKKANENGYTVIRLLQEDVWYNKNGWLDQLTKHMKIYDVPTIICIGDSEKYKHHLKSTVKNILNF